MTGGAPEGEEVPVLDAFGLTDVGRRRDVNEDHFLVADLVRGMRVRHTSLTGLDRPAGLGETSAQLLVVADGVGGLPSGEGASSTAVEALAAYIRHTASCYQDADPEVESEFLERLERAVVHSHDAVRERYRSRGDYAPASTMTMVTVVWPRAYVVHVGDSRCYVLRRGGLVRLTRDQTMAEAMVDEGVLSEEQARRSALQHQLTSAVGVEVAPTVGLIDLEPEDVLLLCSDGLTKHVPDEAIARRLAAGGSAESCCRDLVTAALEDGGSDNVTVIVARLAPHGPGAPSGGEA